MQYSSNTTRYYKEKERKEKWQVGEEVVAVGERSRSWLPMLHGPRTNSSLAVEEEEEVQGVEGQGVGGERLGCRVALA